jgi:hypothetical protein
MKNAKEIKVPTLSCFAWKDSTPLDKYSASIFFNFKSKINTTHLVNGKVPEPFCQIFINNLLLLFKTQAHNFVFLKCLAPVLKDNADKKLSFAQLLSKPIKPQKAASSDDSPSINPNKLKKLKDQIKSLEKELAALQKKDSPSKTLSESPDLSKLHSSKLSPYVPVATLIAKSFTSVFTQHHSSAPGHIVATKFPNGSCCFLHYANSTLTICGSVSNPVDQYVLVNTSGASIVEKFWLCPSQLLIKYPNTQIPTSSQHHNCHALTQSSTPPLPAVKGHAMPPKTTIIAAI